MLLRCSPFATRGPPIATPRKVHVEDVSWLAADGSVDGSFRSCVTPLLAASHSGSNKDCFDACHELALLISPVHWKCFSHLQRICWNVADLLAAKCPSDFMRFKKICRNFPVFERGKLNGSFDRCDSCVCCVSCCCLGIKPRTCWDWSLLQRKPFWVANFLESLEIQTAPPPTTRVRGL